ncbi:unnamed protein product [Blepharisma stoltei]|uniref:Uncharacterized protein n=1 Tax=Blepharisma stoltei TaxID=1481888 RepID=A0AAU9IPP6_9CILI|nr:unnamed protein product [Blepharisma stoltei]
MTSHPLQLIEQLGRLRNSQNNENKTNPSIAKQAQNDFGLNELMKSLSNEKNPEKNNKYLEIPNPKENNKIWQELIKSTGLKSESQPKDFISPNKETLAYSKADEARSMTPTPMKYDQTPPKLPERSIKSKSKSPIRTIDFVPSISEKSKILASRHGKTQERLLNHTIKTITIRPNNASPCQFKPKLNPNSVKMDKAIHKSKHERWETLYKLDSQKKEKWEKIRKNAQDIADAIEEKECTFAPSISCSSIKTPKTKKTWDRLHNWQKFKDQKLEKIREEKKDKELLGCTFTPKIRDLSPSYEDDTLSRIKGIGRYFERQAQSKASKVGVSFDSGNYESTFYTHRDLSPSEYTQAIGTLRGELRSILM